MIALTMEKWNLHKRMALFIIRVIGGGPFFRVPKHVTVDRSIVEKTYKELGSMSFEERSVLIVFFLTAFLWVFRKKTEPGLFDHTRLVTIDSLSQVDCDDIARNSSWGDALVLSIKNRGV